MTGYRETTMHGHSTRCGLCSLAVYGLWVSEEAPPVGCSDGLDAAPWTCSHVLNSIAMGVIRVDHMGGELLPHHRLIEKLIGAQRFAAIIEHVRREHGPPKAGKLRPADYSKPTLQ